MKLEEVKKQLAKKRPKFTRQDSFKKKRISTSWRKPRGLHSKMRLEKKGYRKKVKTGFRSPKILRNTYNGKKIVTVYNIRDFVNISEGAIIVASSVGLKKKIEIINEAKKKNLVIINIKENFVKKKTAALEQSRAKKAKIKAARIKKSSKKKADKKDVKKDKKEISIEDKKKEDKKELDKVLTKKNNNM